MSVQASAMLSLATTRALSHARGALGRLGVARLPLQQQQAAVHNWQTAGRRRRPQLGARAAAASPEAPEAEPAPSAATSSFRKLGVDKRLLVRPQAGGRKRWQGAAAAACCTHLRPCTRRAGAHTLAPLPTRRAALPGGPGHPHAHRRAGSGHPSGAAGRQCRHPLLHRLRKDAGLPAACTDAGGVARRGRVGGRDAQDGGAGGHGAGATASRAWLAVLRTARQSLASLLSAAHVCKPIDPPAARMPPPLPLRRWWWWCPPES